MKYLLVLTTVFALFSSAFSQTIKDYPNAISSKEVTVNGFYLSFTYSTKEKVFEIFGEPIKTTIYREIGDDEIDTYHYDGIEFSSYYGSLEAYDVTSDKFEVLIQNKPFRVGDSIDKLKEAFPDSYKELVRVFGEPKIDDVERTLLVALKTEHHILGFYPFNIGFEIKNNKVISFGSYLGQ